MNDDFSIAMWSEAMLDYHVILDKTYCDPGNVPAFPA